MNDGIFTSQRLLAGVLILVSSCTGWYVLVLMTNPTGDMTPEGVQWRGLCLVVLMAIISWVHRCFSIRIQKQTV